MPFFSFGNEELHIGFGKWFVSLFGSRQCLFQITLVTLAFMRELKPERCSLILVCKMRNSLKVIEPFICSLHLIYLEMLNDVK